MMRKTVKRLLNNNLNSHKNNNCKNQQKTFPTPNVYVIKGMLEINVS